MHSLAAANFQSHALVRATQFLHLRHLAGVTGVVGAVGETVLVDELLNLMDSEVTAYGLNKSDIVSFMFTRNFPTIVSIRADASRNVVAVDYEDCSSLVREEIFFSPAPECKIVSVRGTYAGEGDATSLPLRVGVGVGEGVGEGLGEGVGGAGEGAGVGVREGRTLVTLRLLRLAAAILFTDVHRDLPAYAAYLTDATPAFGAVGREAILEIETQGTKAGTRFSLPFPLLVNAEARCVVVDFLAHSTYSPDTGTSTQRGTDFLYLDIDAQKVLRLDTLRHTLAQPDWVLQHFGGKLSS